MAKTLELVFELAGKIASSFTGATGKAAAELGKVAKQTKAISAAAQARADEKAFKNLYKAAGDTGKAFGRLRSEITGTLLSVAAPAAAAGAAIYGVATTSAGYADQAIKNAQSIGMSTAAFTEMAYAAKMAGVSQQDFVSGSAKLSKSVEAALGGNQQMIDSFARAGISSEELAASLGEPEKLYAKLADTFASMPDGIGKTSLSMALLGKSGSKFIPFLNAGSAAMDQMREDARRLGISLSETEAKNAEAFNDSFANIGESMRGVSLIIGKNLWPHLTKVHEAVSGWISTNGQLFAQNLPGWIESLTPVVAELKTEFYAAWEEVKAGAIVVNNMVQGMGGWIPLVKRLAQAWLIYRGLRIGKALYGTVTSVLDLKRQFIDTLPAMARWIVAKKNAVKSAAAFGKNLISSAIPAMKSIGGGMGAAARAFGNFSLQALKATGAALKFAGAATMNVLRKGVISSAIGGIRSGVTAFASFGRAALSAAGSAANFAFAAGRAGVSGVAGFVKSVFLGIGATAKLAFSTGVSAVRSFGLFAVAAANTAVRALGTFVTAVWAGIKADAGLIRSVGVKAIGAFSSFASTVMAAVVPALAGVAASLGAAATAAYGFAAAILANPITWIVAGIVALGMAIYLCIKYWDDIVAVMSAAWDWIKSVFVAGWNMLPGWIQEPLANAYGAAAGFVDDVIGVFGGMWDAVVGYFAGKGGAVVAAFDQGILTGLWEAIKQFSPLGFFMDAFNAVKDWLLGFDLVGDLIGYFTGKGAAVADAFDQGILSGIWEAIKQFHPLTLFMEAFNAVKNWLLNFDLADAGAELAQKLGDGILNAWAGIKDSIASAVTEWIPGGETLVNMASSGANLVSSGAGAVADAATGAYDWIADLSPFAAGGVVTSPQAALVGEAGPEVIIPVSRPNRARELMDTAAGMMGMGSGGNGAQYTITFSPKISISGGGESVAEQVRQSLFKAEEEFRRRFQKLMHENSRMAMR